jgi:O-antigen/teichoic acid export membrane protein
MILSIAGAILNGIAGLVAARTLGPLQFGSFASAIAAITVLQVLLQGFQFSSQNEFKRDSLENRGQSLNLKMWLFRNFLPLVALITTLLIAFRETLKFTVPQSLGIIAMILPTLALSSIAGFHLWNKDLVRYQLLSSQVALLRLMLSMCAAILISLFPKLNGPALFILALIIGSNIVVAYNWLRTPKAVQPGNFVVKKEAMHFILLITSSWLLMQGDIIVLNSTLDPKSAGTYAAYSSLAKVLITFFGLYGLHVATRYTAIASLSDRISVAFRSAALAFIMILLAIIFGDQILVFLYGERFAVESVSVELLYASSAIWAVFFALLYMRINTIRTLFIPNTMIMILFFSILSLTTVPLTVGSVYAISTISGVLGLIVLVFKN